MKILTNQTVYQCSYCGKKNLTKKGSEIHENQYCKSKDSPCRKQLLDNQGECKHFHVDTKWSYISGECIKEPDYDYCVDCGMVFK